MEIRIKTGEGVECGYSDLGAEPPEAVINIVSSDNCETGWMSRAVLEHALSMFPDMQPAPPRHRAAPVQDDGFHDLAAAQVQSPHPPPPAPAPVRSREPQSNRSSSWQKQLKDPPELLKRFEQALVDLKENPTSTDASGKLDGRITESAIREVVGIYKSAFMNKKAMFGPLSKVLGVQRERFDLMVS